MNTLGRLAQLARASRLHREGRGFEPLSAHHLKSTVQVAFLFLINFGEFFGIGFDL